MKYYSLHFSIHRIGVTLDDFNNDIEKKDKYTIVEEVFEKNNKYKPKRSKPIHFGDFIFSENPTRELRGGRIGKEKIERITEFDEKESSFKDKPQQNVPYVLFTWDRKRQLITIEKKSSVFNDDEFVVKVLEEYLNIHLSKKGYNIKLIPISTENDFWKVISENKKISAVEFTLNTPNFIGRTNREINDLLKETHQETNATSYITAIKNEDGKLHISKDNYFVKLYLDWVNKGEGYWKIIVKKGKTILSKQKLSYEKNDDLIPDTQIENIEKIIEVAGKKYDEILEKDLLNDKDETS